MLSKEIEKVNSKFNVTRDNKKLHSFQYQDILLRKIIINENNYYY